MAKDLELRPYQIESIEGLRAGIKAGHRAQILCAPTGAGKTVCAVHLLREAQRKGSRCMFIVDRTNLVDQTSAVLDAYGIDHGVVQANHWRHRNYEPIQVCSAQTIEKRGFFPDAKIVVIDEAHVVRAQTAEFITNRKDVVVVGLTATPLTKGLGKIYTNVVNVTTTNKLIDDGFLIRPTIYAAKRLDMTGAKVVAGEWAEKDIEDRGLKIIGDVVQGWIDKTQLHFGGPVKTIVFSATVAHGAELCKQFNEAGYNFRQISYKDGSDETRREIIAEYRKPNSDIIGLVSCEVFTRGFDVPDVLCGISARPYRKSLSSHIQQLGRILRPAPGKTGALWLCCSGNAIRFREDVEEIFANGVSSLDDGAREERHKEPQEKEIKEHFCECGYLLSAEMETCPACGKQRSRRAMVENVPGELVAIDGKARKKKSHPILDNRERVMRQLSGWAMERKNGNEDAAKRWAAGQYKSLYGVWPRGVKFDPSAPNWVDAELRNLVTSNIIRWAKSKQRAA